MNLQTEKTRVTLNNKQKSQKKLPKGLKLPASAASAHLARDEQGCVGGIRCSNMEHTGVCAPTPPPESVTPPPRRGRGGRGGGS